MNEAATVRRRPRQSSVKSRQSLVNSNAAPLVAWFGADMTEQWIAGLLAVALIGYLVYALVRPERF